MKELPVKGGLGLALLDNEDYKWARKYRWYWDRGYIRRRVDGKTTQFLHREVMGNPKGFCVDHKNHNKWDCQRSNLRICTKAENTRYMRRHKICVSGYKGVKPNFGGSRKQIPMWQAEICKNYKTYRLGTYHDKHISALMYDFWATYLFKNFAITNFEVVSTSEKPIGGEYGQIRKLTKLTSHERLKRSRGEHVNIQKAKQQAGVVRQVPDSSQQKQ